MCRLFGMSGSPRRTHATFWLLDAPDSLSDQSRREPDGTGLGYFDATAPRMCTRRPLLERRRGGQHGDRHLDHSGTAGHLRVHCRDLADTPAVVVASERMDDNPAWRLMEAGELLHVGPDLGVTRTIALPHEPRHRLDLTDLRPEAAESQQTS